MNSKILGILILFIVIFTAAGIILTLKIYPEYLANYFPKNDNSAVLGMLSGIAVTSQNNQPAITIPVATSTPTLIPTVTPSATPSPTPKEIKVTINNLPTEILEGSNGTFDWHVDGPDITINTTTVYFGNTSTPGNLAQNITPDNTHYTGYVKDFINGNYGIPLKFIGNSIVSIPGINYARAYVYANGKHYWSEERFFVVKPLPKNEVKMIYYPTDSSPESNITFTWEITGPYGSTGYTAIVAGKESKSGSLDENTGLSGTPYNNILIKDFTGGSYRIPLRFVGNTKISETGTYYFRAYALVNNKNIWSDEHSFTIK